MLFTIIATAAFVYAFRFVMQIFSQTILARSRSKLPQGRANTCTLYLQIGTGYADLRVPAVDSEGYTGAAVEDAVKSKSFLRTFCRVTEMRAGSSV